MGIDPGSRKTGWGVVDVVGSSIRHVDNGVLFLDDSSDLLVRLVDLSHRLRDRLIEHQPTLVAVEDVFVQKNARSALILGQARGAALATIGLMGLSVRSFAPSVVKKSVSGAGGADKLQVATMVSMLLQLPELPFEDAADALAVALCCAAHARMPSVPVPLKKKSTSVRAGFAALAKKQAAHR
jgi:crossover junction endodeoxyribonuclease RuvC